MGVGGRRWAAVAGKLCVILFHWNPQIPADIFITQIINVYIQVYIYIYIYAYIYIIKHVICYMILICMSTGSKRIV